MGKKMTGGHKAYRNGGSREANRDRGMNTKLRKLQKKHPDREYEIKENDKGNPVIIITNKAELNAQVQANRKKKSENVKNEEKKNGKANDDGSANGTGADKSKVDSAQAEGTKST